MASDSQLELAHVLFIDIVGYSRLLNDDQREFLQTLNESIRGSTEFKHADEAGKLRRLPTGDGVALVFFTSPAAPVQCAVEISAALKEHPEVRVRMGIHSGPVSEIVDVNQQSNVAGGGINMAQRVMDCADAGHILLSKRVGEDLAQYRQWQPFLHDIGSVEVKHGFTIDLVNFYGPDFGNPAMPDKCGSQKTVAGAAKAPAGRSIRSTKAIAILAAATAILLAAAATWWFTTHKKGGDVAASRPPETEKSIAVLPFQNLSANPENAFFADGVQDEILTTLGKLADLKVIGRTSVMQFKDPEKRNLREIAQALNVAHVLEGSVQRAANRVRVTAQLIDARSNTQLWAERYDRDLADVFAIQTEIARNIAGELQAALSPREKAALEARPTTDTVAYDLYLQAREIYRSQGDIGEGLRDSTARTVRLLEEAISRDPEFVPALCLLAHAHLGLYWFYLDHTPARLELARKAIEQAARVQPDAGQVHFARGLFHYHGNREFDAALAELELARRSLPNEAEIPHYIGAILRRQGRWEESMRRMEEAMEIDPRSAFLARDRSWSYLALRRYDEARRILENVLAWKPEDLAFQLGRADIDFLEKADLRSLQKVIAEAPAATNADLLAIERTQLALLRRDYPALAQAIAEYRRADIAGGGYVTPREYFEGIAARGQGDLAGAERAFLRARERAAAHVEALPDEAKALMVLAEVDVKLGRKDEARREAERAAEMLPVAKDAFHGPGLRERLAGVYAQIGDTERALTVLEEIVGRPAGPHYGVLRLEQSFEALRGHPRFEEMLASLAPKAAPPAAK
jgi:TolB-like protein/Flp pilus assembly protein TadD